MDAAKVFLEMKNTRRNLNIEVMNSLRQMADGLPSLTSSKELAVLIAHERIMNAIINWANNGCYL